MNTSGSQGNAKSMTIFGCFEDVTLPDFGNEPILAKIDTGAYSGALHCTDIKIVRRGVIRKRYLKFVPFGKQSLATETDEFITRIVRSATGHRVRRYLIQTSIEAQGKHYPIQIGLSDRSDMKFQILLGRRFLRENKILVDVNQNVHYDDEGETLQ